MPTEKKAQAIAELAERLRGAHAIVLTDYRGLPTPELNALRGRLRDAAGEYHIVKNTLLGIAAEQIGVRGLDVLLQGPTAMALSGEKDVDLARAVFDYVRTSRTSLAVKGGILGDSPLTAAEVEELAMLPPRRDLEARLAGSIQSPLASLIGVLDAALSELVRVIQEREKQLTPAPEPEPAAG